MRNNLKKMNYGFFFFKATLNSVHTHKKKLNHPLILRITHVQTILLMLERGGGLRKVINVNLLNRKRDGVETSVIRNNLNFCYNMFDREKLENSFESRFETPSPLIHIVSSLLSGRGAKETVESR